MKQIRNFADDRQTDFCAYCGSATESRDHVPSKILLDVPYPENLIVVPACQKCNQGFSLHEEYFACLLECVHAGTTESDRIERDKVKCILAAKPTLANRLSKGRQQDIFGGTSFMVEIERVRHVVLKLARGHAAFELNEPRLEEPSVITFAPLISLPQETQDDFEKVPTSEIWPEVGSRAMQRILTGDDLGAGGWIVVQPGRYRYCTNYENGVMVRMVLREYLACEVMWLC